MIYGLLEHELSQWMEYSSVSVQHWQTVFFCFQSILGFIPIRHWSGLFVIHKAERIHNTCILTDLFGSSHLEFLAIQMIKYQFYFIYFNPFQQRLECWSLKSQISILLGAK